MLATNGHVEPQLHLLQTQLVSGTCIIVGESCPPEQRQRLEAYGVEVLPAVNDEDGRIDLHAALEALAYRGIMHVLLEGGAKLLGTAFDRSIIDHAAVFVAPKLIGGAQAPVPVQGRGLASMGEAVAIQSLSVHMLDGDLLIEGEIEPIS